MLNHRTFTQFKSLEYLDLSGNICIDKKFGTPEDFARIERDFAICNNNLEIQEIKLKIDEIWDVLQSGANGGQHSNILIIQIIILSLFFNYFSFHQH
jgi:hypothetical protein